MTALPYQTQPLTEPRLGLVVLSADETIERDFARMLPEGLSLNVTRVPSGLDVTNDTLAAMEHHLTSAASLLPQADPFDVVAYGCTSGTAVIGARKVATMIRKGVAARSVTDPVSALVAACETLAVKRLGILSPYLPEVSDRLRAVLCEHGIETPVFGSFNESDEATVVRITPGSITSAAGALARQGGIDGLFLSCTNLRTLEVIEEIEATTGLPVLSSNLVLGWHMCQLAKVTGPVWPRTALTPTGA